MDVGVNIELDARFMSLSMFRFLGPRDDGGLYSVGHMWFFDSHYYFDSSF